MPGRWLLLGCLLTAVPAGAQDISAAEAFIRGLYPAASDAAPSFFDMAALPAIATPSLTALRRKDDAMSMAAEDPSDLNFDPLCACQDDGNMKLGEVTVRQTGPGRALATVTLQFPAERILLAIDLEAVDGAWRIDNIIKAAEPFPWDLRSILTQSISGYPTPVKR